MALSTMALLEFLDGPESASQFFASLPPIDAALDTVFRDGDLTGNGVTDVTDLNIWKAGFGDPAGATPAQGDADGDGDVDGADFLRWHRGLGLGAPAGLAVPEPTLWIYLSAAAGFLGARRWRRERASFSHDPEIG
jgi:hypothetical protein